MRSSLTSLIVAVVKKNYVEYLTNFIAFSESVYGKKSDFEWFATTDRNCFVVQTLHEISHRNNTFGELNW